MSPDEYFSLSAKGRADFWLERDGARTEAEEALLLAEEDPWVLRTAYGLVIREPILQQLYDKAVEPVDRELISTNPGAPLHLIGAVPVGRQIGASIAMYLERRGVFPSEDVRLGPAVTDPANADRPLREVVDEVVGSAE